MPRRDEAWVLRLEGFHEVDDRGGKLGLRQQRLANIFQISISNMTIHFRKLMKTKLQNISNNIILFLVLSEICQSRNSRVPFAEYQHSSVTNSVAQKP